MTRIVKIGKNKAFLVLYVFIISLTSCSNFNSKLFLGEDYSYYDTFYLNDSLKCSIKLAGDNIQISDKKELKKALKVNEVNSFKKNIVEFFRTKTPPYYDLFLLHFENKSQLDDFILEHDFEFINYSNENNQIEIIDSVSFMYGSGISNINEEYSLFICFSTLKEQEIFKMMVKEYRVAFKTMIYSDYYRQILPSPFKMARDYSFNLDDSITNYLRPIEKLFEYQDMFKPDDFMYIQAVCTYSSRVSNSKVFDTYFKKYNDLIYYDTVLENDFISNDMALEKILSLCSKSNLAMFNENHFDIRHRMLLKLLLKDLYKIGYRHLALEALAENTEAINKRGYPIQKSGFYTLEPEMADLIRQAISLGFTVFGYDSSGEDREMNQAKNIYMNSFSKDSLAKVVVLGGHNHIYEKKTQNKKWMGFYIQELYAINPTTFSQTSVKIIDSFWLGIAENDSLTKEPVDYIISNNLSETNVPSNKTVDVHFELSIKNPFKNDYLLSVYFVDEYENNIKSIPVKNIVVPYRIDTVKLNLQPGAYLYTIRDKRGEVLHTSNFIIND